MGWGPRANVLHRGFRGRPAPRGLVPMELLRSLLWLGRDRSLGSHQSRASILLPFSHQQLPVPSRGHPGRHGTQEARPGVQPRWRLVDKTFPCWASVSLLWMVRPVVSTCCDGRLRAE